MSRISILSTFMILLLGISFSCSNETGVAPLGCGANFNYLNAVEGELNTLNNAIVAFSADQSEANCNSLKSAYRDYIDALKSVDECVPSSERAAWRQALDEAEANVDSIC